MNQSEELRRVNQILSDHFFGHTREPRWRFFQTPDGYRFFWTTEKYEDDAHWMAGKYVSGVYKPVGKGSRSGKASRLELIESKCVGHKTRRAAKARALRLYNQQKAKAHA